MKAFIKRGPLQQFEIFYGRQKNTRITLEEYYGAGKCLDSISSIGSAQRQTKMLHSQWTESWTVQTSQMAENWIYPKGLKRIEIKH